MRRKILNSAIDQSKRLISLRYVINNDTYLNDAFSFQYYGQLKCLFHKQCDANAVFVHQFFTCLLSQITLVPYNKSKTFFKIYEQNISY